MSTTSRGASAGGAESFRRDEHLGQHAVKRRVARGAPDQRPQSIAGIDQGLPASASAADGRGAHAHATLWP